MTDLNPKQTDENLPGKMAANWKKDPNAKLWKIPIATTILRKFNQVNFEFSQYPMSPIMFFTRKGTDTATLQKYDQGNSIKGNSCSIEYLEFQHYHTATRHTVENVILK